jgi:hypothetical protein
MVRPIDALFQDWFVQSGADRTHEQNARVAGDTADIKNGQFLILKRCLCPVTFCNYKCLNIIFYPNSTVF